MDFELLQWELSLVPSLAESANDARITLWLNEGFPNPYTLEDAERFIDAAQKDSRAFHRAIVSEGKVLGGIDLAFNRGAMRYGADLGYWLTPACWGRGIMTEAVRRFCGTAFAETDICRIQAEVFAPNAASLRVLEKCGFCREGVKRRSVFKNGEFYDSIVMALIKE